MSEGSNSIGAMPNPISRLKQAFPSGERGKQGEKRVVWGPRLRLLSLVVVILCSILIIFSLAVVGAFPIGVVKFILLLVFYVLLPGYAFARLLADRYCSSQLIAFCMTFSVALLIVFYFADELVIKYQLTDLTASAGSTLSSLGMGKVADFVARGALLGFFGPPIVSAISAILLVRDFRKGNVTLASFRLDIRIVAMIAVAVVISFFTIYMYISFPVDQARYTSVYFDQAWLTSNDASVALGWPADGFQYMGKHLNSNIFANIIRASLTRAGGFSSAEMYGICSAFIAVPFCIIAVNALGQRFYRNANKAMFTTFAFVFVRFFSVAILYFFDLDKAAGIAQGQTTYFHSTMTNLLRSPNGIDLALPVVAVTVILLLQICDDKRLSIGKYAALFAISALLTGAKYVFAVCVLCAVFGTMVIRVIRNRAFDQQSKRLLITGVVVVAGFALVYFSVVRGGEVYMLPTAVEPVYAADAYYNTYTPEEYEYSGTYSEMSIGAIVAKSQLFSDVKTIFYIPSAADKVLAVVLIPLHFALMMIMVSVPFLLWVGSKLRRFREVSALEMICAGMAISGVLIYYLISVDGNSQAYFFFCSSLFVNLIGAGWVYDHFSVLKRCWKIVLAICLVLGLSSTIAASVGWMKPGAVNLYHVFNGKYTEQNAPDYNSMTGDEYEAMMWIRDNTPVDAVLAVDRHFSQKVSKKIVPEPNQYASRYYYYTAYSERQAFIGSWAYMSRTPEMQQQLVERLIANDALYSNECLNRREIMEANGISYIVLSKFDHPFLTIEDDDLEVVFKNRDITVYALTRKAV